MLGELADADRLRDMAGEPREPPVGIVVERQRAQRDHRDPCCLLTLSSVDR